MRPATPLKDAYEFARRKHGDKLENPHLLQGTLLSEHIKRPSLSAEERREAERACTRALVAYFGGKAA